MLFQVLTLLRSGRLNDGSLHLSLASSAAVFLRVRVFFFSDLLKYSMGMLCPPSPNDYPISYPSLLVDTSFRSRRDLSGRFFSRLKRFPLATASYRVGILFPRATHFLRKVF